MKRTILFDRIAGNITDRDSVKMTELLTLVFLHLQLSGSVDWWWIIIFSPLVLQYGVFIFVLYREVYIQTRMAKQEKDKKDERVSEIAKELGVGDGE